MCGGKVVSQGRGLNGAVLGVEQRLGTRCSPPESLKLPEVPPLS